MCGSQPNLPPEVNPKVERERIAAEATQSANAKAAYDRKQMRGQSLLSVGGAMGLPGNAASTSSVLAQGKAKLGAGG